jgi:type III restriction enzyme
MTVSIDNPILNSPYEQPDRYYEIGPTGPTGEVKDGRRPSESFIPIAVTEKGKGGSAQESLDFDATGEAQGKETRSSMTSVATSLSGGLAASTPA